MRRGLTWSAVILAAAAGGYLLGAASAPAPDRAAARRDAREEPWPPPPAARAEAPGDVATRLREALGAEPGPEQLAEAEQRARELRDLGRRTIEKADEVAAREVAERVRAEKKLLEDADAGGPTAVLRALADAPVRPFALLEDGERFHALFERRTPGPLLDGAAWRRGDALPAGATLSFPPGAHEWRGRPLDAVKPFPRDLLVAGAGMDVTLVRLGQLTTSEEVVGLTFRDVTIDCGDNYLADFRTRTALSVRLERCRVVRFDSGAGGSLFLYAGNPIAFLAVDCRFEGGFGRSPGSGNLFRLDGGGAVRLERCLVRGPLQSLYDSRANYLFDGCDLEDLDARLENELHAPPKNVRLTDCRITFRPAGSPALRPLSDLNPAWGSAGG